MATKRVHNIAKELGVQSKAIIDKCQHEGIPESVVKNHMSVVGAGLEATIREWFSSAASEGGVATAVETTDKVDLVQARTRPRHRHGESHHDAPAHDDGHADDTAHHDEGHGQPAQDQPHRESAVDARAGSQVQPAAEPAKAASVAATGDEAGSGPVTASPPASASPVNDEANTAAAVAAAAPAGATRPEATPAPRQGPANLPRPMATTLTPTTLTPTTLTPTKATPPAQSGDERGDAASRPAASGPGSATRAAAGPATGPGGGPSGGSSGGSGSGPLGPNAGGPRSGPSTGPQAGGPQGGGPKPAPMNVPTRPKVITPAGPQLDTTKRAAVKLSGPKVVRVEAPERLEPPRPRRAPRDGDGGPMGPSGPSFVPGGAGAPGGPPGDGGDDGRGNKRRSGGTGVPARRRGRADTAAGVPTGAWSEQDLAEREIRLQRAGGYLKQRRQELRRQGGVGDRAQTPAQRGGKVTITEPFTIKDLSAATGVKGAEIVKKLFMQGVMANINSGIDPAKAQEIMIDYDIDLEVVESKSAEQKVSEAFKDRETVNEMPRGPVVTILGHVDHGKTSLLDKIRNANVAAGEAGGITQATSAFRVPLEIGGESRNVVFIDTPGHAAFTAMRARGANVTDIVVLVVAADDGVMPQTIESINHAKAAKVPIVVALNKIDKPEATDSNIQRILGQLAEHGLNPTEWGGETEVVRVSATKGVGIQDLLEILDLQAQVLELKADFGGSAAGTVIEAKPIEGRGSVANILVQAGELKVGDFIVMGRAFGRIRDITDDRGQRQKSALPPMPVQISGIDLLPDAGDKFFVVDSLKKAEQAAEQRREKERHEQLAQPKMTLDRMFSQIAEKDLKEILVVLKADVQGSVDVLKHEIEKVSTDEIKVRVLHAAVGGITESDVLLAEASRAAIVGFNVIPSGKARREAEAKGVEIRQYQVIYDIVEDMKKAAEGMLAPELRQEVLGHAEVRQVFKVSKVGAIAGCYITDGTVERDALVRVTRSDIIVENERRLEQLKRFKDDAKEVRAGMECGMKIAGYDDIKVGDIIECYKQVEVRRTL